MAAASYLRSGSGSPGEVSGITAAGVQAAAGDIIFLAMLYRYTGGEPTVVTPTWNSENFAADFTRVAIGPGSTANHYLEVFKLTCASSGTYDITANFTGGTYRRVTYAYVVVTADSVGTWSTEEEWEASGYSNPSLAIGSMTADDLILEIVGASNWDESFGDMSATTWGPANSQTERQDINSGDAGGHLVIATHTGTGSVTIGYTPSANQPGFAHAAVRLVGSGGSSQAPRSHNQHSRRRAA